MEMSDAEEARLAGERQARFAGWWVRCDDSGRLQATRDRPFAAAARRAGAHRVVTADGAAALVAAIAEQERIAEEHPEPT